MRKILIAILVVIALFTLTACGNKAEKTAQSFLNAMEKHDFTAAKELATSDSQQLLTMAESFVSAMSEEQKSGMDKMKYQIKETKVTGDSAVVIFDEWDEKTPDSKKENELKMIKENGNWKVKLEKDKMSK